MVHRLLYLLKWTPVVIYALLMWCVEKMLSVIVHSIPSLKMIWSSTFGVGLEIAIITSHGRIMKSACFCYFFSFTVRTNMMSYMYLFRNQDWAWLAECCRCYLQVSNFFQIETSISNFQGPFVLIFALLYVCSVMSFDANGLTAPPYRRPTINSVFVNK